MVNAWWLQSIAHRYQGSLDLDAQAVHLAEERCKFIHEAPRQPPCIFLKWRTHLADVGPGHPLWDLLTRDVKPDKKEKMDSEDSGERHEAFYEV